VVSWKLAFALVVLGGCYADLRGGPSVPVGFGHGDAGAEFMLAVGGEHAGETLRIGGGVAMGTRSATGAGAGEYYTATGIDGHIAFVLAPRTPWVVVAHVTAGHARARGNGVYGPASSGIFSEAFAGIGLGRTHDQPGSDLPRGHIAVGPSATWFRADTASYGVSAGDSFWFVGGMLEISVGFGAL
jgi:hypothetical protein